MSSIVQSPAWKALEAHRAAFDLNALKARAGDARHVTGFSLELPGLHADLSRHLATEETITLLVKLAETCGLEKRRRELFEGGHVNNTEDRAALHTLLRAAPA